MDPSQLEERELQAVSRSFLDKIEKVLGPTRDIPAPDVGTDAQVMAWLMDEYGKLHGHTPACVTGKPIALEGSYGREAATGPRGRVHVPRGRAAPGPRARPRRPSPCRATATWARGPRGSCSSSASRMVAASDASGAIRSDGRHRRRGARRARRGGRCCSWSFPGAEPIDPDDLLAVECDVFIPAALGGMIHRDNADRLRCRMIVEGANSPTTPAADEILREKGVYVVPDVMANAGGVVVSYFEWVQNLQHFRWDEREVNDRLGRIMRKAFREVSARSRETGHSAARGGLRAGDRAGGGGGHRARLHLLTWTRV